MDTGGAWVEEAREDPCALEPVHAYFSIHTVLSTQYLDSLNLGDCLQSPAALALRHGTDTHTDTSGWTKDPFHTPSLIKV